MSFCKGNWSLFRDQRYSSFGVIANHIVIPLNCLLSTKPMSLIGNDTRKCYISWNYRAREIFCKLWIGENNPVISLTNENYAKPYDGFVSKWSNYQIRRYMPPSAISTILKCKYKGLFTSNLLCSSCCLFNLCTVFNPFSKTTYAIWYNKWQTWAISSSLSRLNSRCQLQFVEEFSYSTMCEWFYCKNRYYHKYSHIPSDISLLPKTILQLFHCETYYCKNCVLYESSRAYSTFKSINSDNCTRLAHIRPLNSVKNPLFFSPPAMIFVAIFLLFSGYVYSYSVEKQITLKECGNRFLAQFEDYSMKITDSVNDWMYKHFPDSSDPLLPDFHELKYPEFLPTLVIDLDKTVVHLEHKRRTGWSVVKRPGADRFFRELMNYYEIVVWSDDNYPVAQEVMMMWGVPVIGCIHRDQCRRRGGVYVKDLSRLGRQLDRTIIIDHDPGAFMLQPENGIQIKEYYGDTDDNELESLIDLLKTIATSPEDVRTHLKKYGGGDLYVGKRFLALKSEHEKKSEARRYLGKVVGMGSNQSLHTNKDIRSSFGSLSALSFK